MRERERSCSRATRCKAALSSGARSTVKGMRRVGGCTLPPIACPRPAWYPDTARPGRRCAGDVALRSGAAGAACQLPPSGVFLSCSLAVESMTSNLRISSSYRCEPVSLPEVITHAQQRGRGSNITSALHVLGRHRHDSTTKFRRPDAEFGRELHGRGLGRDVVELRPAAEEGRHRSLGVVLAVVAPLAELRTCDVRGLEIEDGFAVLSASADIR
jgi:hypothetical protein